MCTSKPLIKASMPVSLSLARNAIVALPPVLMKEISLERFMLCAIVAK
jgi:hypothetical protein